MSIPLALIAGASECDSVGGSGWYFVENVPGLIVMAPAVVTFEVCEKACAEIAAHESWWLEFDLNVCE